MINLHSSVLKRQIDLNSEASMGDFYNIVSQFKIEGKIKDILPFLRRIFFYVNCRNSIFESLNAINRDNFKTIYPSESFLSSLACSGRRLGRGC